MPKITPYHSVHCIILRRLADVKFYLGVIFLLPSCAVAQDGLVHIAWQNRYVTEGRDNLAGKDIVAASAEFNVDTFIITPWVANAIGIDYKEFNLNLIYTHELVDDLSLHASYGYVYSRTYGASFNDNEVGLGLVYQMSERIESNAHIYHSFDAKGSFMELAMIYSDEISENLYYAIQGAIGVNADYVPDGHNGLNHVHLNVGILYQPETRLKFNAFSGYILAIDRDEKQYAGDILLGDFIIAGVGATYLF